MFKIFKKEVAEKEDEIEVLEKEIKGLRKDKQKAEDELATMKHETKMGEEDIKHMVKMKEEKLDIEHEKKITTLEKEKDKAIAVVKDKYRDKLEERLMKETDTIKGMYSEVLKRLPNLNAKMKIDV